MKIYKSNTIFTDSRFEISISDGISHDGLELSIRNMENPKEYVSVPLDKETIRNLATMFKNAEFYEDVKKLSKWFVVGHDPYDVTNLSNGSIGVI